MNQKALIWLFATASSILMSVSAYIAGYLISGLNMSELVYDAQIDTTANALLYYELSESGEATEYRDYRAVLKENVLRDVEFRLELEDRRSESELYYRFLEGLLRPKLLELFDSIMRSSYSSASRVGQIVDLTPEEQKAIERYMAIRASYAD